ncbi:MAG: Fur family transcriptional regulator [Anaerolineae bacterium]|jgi:Fe2+ or Zn2+ uptake regulation protein|nr:Fur family transcriptional regulator [Anaerolineae bacterium]
MQATDRLIQQFHEKGLKVTPQRRVIFELLAEDKSHPTAEEIYRRVTAVMPEVSRTTVYNTLRELTEIGQLNEVEEISESGTRYDTNTSDHHHLFCVNCHALIDISRDFEGLQLPEEEMAGYRILKSQVTFYGYCPKCQQR